MNRYFSHALDDDEDLIWDRIASLDDSSEEELNSPRENHGPRHGSNSVPNVPFGRGDGMDGVDDSPRGPPGQRDRSNSSNDAVDSEVDDMDWSKLNAPHVQSRPRDRSNSSNDAVLVGGGDDMLDNW
jgi:hypothetical protein